MKNQINIPKLLLMNKLFCVIGIRILMENNGIEAVPKSSTLYSTSKTQSILIFFLITASLLGLFFNLGN